MTKVTFNTVGPYARAPASQTITGTVTGLTTSGTLYIRVVANNPGEAFTVSSVTIAGESGQAHVIPAEPSSLGKPYRWATRSHPEWMAIRSRLA
jgi:hypothetical protein